MVKKMFFWRLLIPLSQTIGTLFLGSLVCCDKTGCRTHFYATTDATRCPALMPGILVDPLAAYSIVRRREPRRSAETFAANPRNGGPKHFQTDFAFFPPLSIKVLSCFSGVKDAPAARGDHFPHILWCKFPKLRKVIWFFFQKPIIGPTPIIKLLTLMSILPAMPPRGSSRSDPFDPPDSW